MLRELLMRLPDIEPTSSNELARVELHLGAEAPAGPLHATALATGPSLHPILVAATLWTALHPDLH
jgi:hypothetical protein